MTLPSRIALSAGSVAAALALLVAVVPTAHSQTIVRGVVIDHETRQPISLVDVRLTDADSINQAVSLTDDAGRFRLEIAEGGTFRLSARRLGYAAVSADSVLLDRDDEMQIEIRLAPEAVALDAIVVVAHRSSGWGRLGAALERAERNQMSGRGRIYMRDDLERIRGGTVQALVDGQLWGTRCQPTILLNGMPAEGFLFGLSIDELEAVEFYRHGHDIPAEHYRIGMCAAALLWTRPESSRRPWSWTRLGVAGALVAIVTLLVR